MSELRPAGYGPARPDRRPSNKKGGAVGHDKLLKNLIANSGSISIRFVAPTVAFVKGVVVASDRYTISVKEGGITRIIFKHSILDFAVTDFGTPPVV